MPLNFNPQEQAMLSNLLAALQSGLGGAQAAPVLQDVLGMQDARVTARREQMGSLTDQILGLASSGQPLTAAGSYLSSLGASGSVGPRMMDRLEDVTMQAYDATPRPGGGIPLFNPNGGPTSLSTIANAQPGLLSPMSPQQPMTPTELPGPAEEIAGMADSIRLFAEQGMTPEQAQQAMLATGVDPMSIPFIQQLIQTVYADLGA